jgi:hypothetical protein
MFGFRKTRTENVTDALKTALSYTDELIRDTRLRSDIRSAVRHGAIAAHRMREDTSFPRLTSRLAADRELRKNLRSLLDDVDSAGGRVRHRTSHRFRNALLMVGVTGAIFAVVPNTRRWAMERLPAMSPNGDDAFERDRDLS